MAGDCQLPNKECGIGGMVGGADEQPSDTNIQTAQEEFGGLDAQSGEMTRNDAYFPNLYLSNLQACSPKYTFERRGFFNWFPMN